MLDPADQLLRMQIQIERHDALADMLGVIADPLEVVAHPHGADDLAQVDGHRLAAGDGQYRLLLDVVLHGIDDQIGGDHPLGEIDVPIAPTRAWRRRFAAPPIRPSRRPCARSPADRRRRLWRCGPLWR